MKEIIAMHGWAGDSTQWSSWIDFFESCDWRWQSAERGYKDINPYTPRWYNNIHHNRLKRVVICHSLGSYLIDKEILSSATHVVLINSFSRFIPRGKENRSIRMALNKMMNSINTPNEPSMLRKFHMKAHKPNDIDMGSKVSNPFHLSDAGRLRLKNDLKLLMNSDSLPTGLSTYAKVLVINSQKDYILVKQTKQTLTKDLINFLKTPPTIIELKEEGHSISKIKNIKKIKHWLEFDHANKMVKPS